MANVPNENENVIQERRSQYKILRTALTAVGLPPVFFLHGLPSSGKSFVIEKVLEDVKFSSAIKGRISAVEATCGKRAFFENIIRQLGVENEDSKSKTRCENGQMFLRLLKKKFQRSLTPVIVIIENCELMNSDQNKEILITLLLAHNYCGINICFILCSTLPLSSFMATTGGVRNSIPTIYFPQYSKEEIISIICRERPKSADLNRYKFYVKALVDVFYRNCRELRKLKRLAYINYDAFAQSIPDTVTNVENSAATPKTATNSVQLHKLWKNIEPKLKSDFITLSSQFLAITDTSQTNKIVRGVNMTPGGSLPRKNSSSDSSAWNLPQYSKYTLIAAFIASHNPPASDKRYFVKAKMKNTSVAAAKKRFITPTTVGSKPTKVITINRLQAILSALSSTNSIVIGQKRSFSRTSMSMDTVIMSQLTTLCDAGFLVVTGSADSLENRKYKCCADFELVNALANSLGLELTKYLYEFL